MQQAQAMMAEFRSASTSAQDPRSTSADAVADEDGPAVITNDAFHDPSDVHPFHLPHIWNRYVQYVV